MTTVDDLVVSLRIDDTSNLGKLQKQLTALVGPKGDKAIGIGVDPNLKRDLEFIKDRVIKFTPTVLLDENIKQGALALASDLKKDSDIRQNLMQKHNINIDKYEMFIDELYNIALGISEQNSDQSKKFIAEMDRFRKLSAMTKSDVKGTITRLTKMMLEKGFHKRVVKALREAGVRLLSKPGVWKITKKSLGNLMDEPIKRLKGLDEKRFGELVEIFKTTADGLEAIGKAYYLQTEKNLDMTQLTEKSIYDSVEMHQIIAAQAQAAKTKEQRMQRLFYKVGMQLFTGKTAFGDYEAQLDSVFSKISPKLLEKLGIEHIAGMEITDDMRNILAEYKTVVGKDEVDKERRKRINDQKYNKMFLFAEEFTDEALETIEEFLLKEENKGITLGAYKITTRAVDKLLGIASDLDVKEKQAKESLEEEEEEKEKKQKEAETMRKTFANLDEMIEGGPEGVEGTKQDEEKIINEAESRYREIKKGIDEVKQDTTEIKKKVSEEDLNEPDVEKNPEDGT